MLKLQAVLDTTEFRLLFSANCISDLTSNILSIGKVELVIPSEPKCIKPKFLIIRKHLSIEDALFVTVGPDQHWPQSKHSGRSSATLKFVQRDPVLR